MPLPNLLIELIERICSDLETLDLNSLRLTCKTLLQKSQVFYDQRHYGTIWMMVTSDSLRCLKEIAQDDYLRTLVKQLVILPVMFEDQKTMKQYPSFQESPFGGYSWSRTNWEDAETQMRFESYKNSVAGHEYALKSLQEVLEGCLAQFTNLDAFRLQSESTGDLLRAATIPFPGCLGLGKFRNQLKIHPNRYMVDTMTENMGKVSKVGGIVFTAVLKAVIANNRNIRKLETCADRHGGVSFSKLKLTPTEFQALISLAKGIECLHICPRRFHQRGVKPKLDPRKAFIDLVLASASSLTTLEMTDYRNEFENGILSELSPTASFTRLRELHLSSIVTSLHDFKGFLSTATSTLEVLKLEKVTMSDETAAKSGLRQDKKKLVHEFWREAWDFLRDTCSLKFFSMELLKSLRADLQFVDYPSLSNGQSDTHAQKLTGIAYNEAESQISFVEWIDSLETIP
ncbi:hypothetical protein N7494_005906 [Penicillium frequentans]|uniref:F-box domain-containing protein n=1 Tax=Penicillium frequentans TaxID=3151616 RepID=A0AAD6CV88_9EURO|nr:hypothetical protein N7494_005906 [Penicillium glabrum]